MRFVLCCELTAEAYNDTKKLVSICEAHDDILMKLELEGKTIVANASKLIELDFDNVIEAFSALGPKEQGAYTEFYCYDGERVVGYISISIYGSGPMEVTGLVHPDYRRRGIFNKLFKLVEMTWLALNKRELLLISDERSKGGLAFINKHGGRYSHTEYNMILKGNQNHRDSHDIIKFRRASNKDAAEIAYQNSLYFCIEYDETNMPLPEAEALRGIEVFMVEYQNQLIGKVHLQVHDKIGHIYGLGILPRFRGLGYGKMVLEKSVKELAYKGAMDIRLEVASENETALNLYTSVGFEVINAMVYYRFLHDKN